MNINKNSNTPPVCNTQMGTTRLWCQTSVGTQRKRQNYPPTRRQNIYTKVGRRFIYYAKSVGHTMLLVLDTLAAAQSK